MDFVEKIQKCHEYVEALEEERKKIRVFQRELPLCLELVTQAIEACKRELSGNSTTTDHYMHGHSECSEQATSSNGRPVVLEEFMPLKRTNSSSHNDNGDDHESNDEDEDEDEHQSHERNNSNDQKQKSDWLRSVQLWNQSPDPPVDEDVMTKKGEVKKNNGGAFQPFHKEKSSNGKNNKTAKNASTSVPATSVSENGGKGSKNGYGDGKKDDKDGQNQRKQRRCWSPELHRRFMHALQQLGGSHATPKQIRELMKVDGLTNDEVKSHLQKYRLHTRRPSPTIHNNNNAAAPQFLVVGGIWVPPPDYATVAATGSGDTATIAAANGIYAPVAAPLPTIPRKQQKHHPHSDHLQSEGRSSRSQGGHRCAARSNSNSPATSSSTHTITNSPVF